jgi:hypothetical protein
MIPVLDEDQKSTNRSVSDKSRGKRVKEIVLLDDASGF